MLRVSKPTAARVSIVRESRGPMRGRGILGKGIRRRVVLPRQRSIASTTVLPLTVEITASSLCVGM